MKVETVVVAIYVMRDGVQHVCRQSAEDTWFWRCGACNGGVLGEHPELDQLCPQCGARVCGIAQVARSELARRAERSDEV